VTSTIFYSWQSDAPTRTGRNFIERTLARALVLLKADLDLEEAARDLEIDRDTKGVPGSPKIVDTIFAKIDSAEAFVADVTFVGLRKNGEPIPNSNVMIEYGWALNSLGHDRVVCVMNSAYGAASATSLPFDMRHIKWPIEYFLPDDATTDEVKAVRADLARTLSAALRDILNIPKAPPAPPADFQCRPCGASPGRFRPPEMPLAYSDDSFGGSTDPVTLSAGPVSWLRVMPKLDPGRTWSFTELKAAATTNDFFFVPYCMGGGAAGIGWLRGTDGFGTRVVMSNTNDALWTSFVFNTGEIWGTDAFIMSATNGYIAIDQQGMVNALKGYRSLLKRLGIEAPFVWIAGVEGTMGRGVPLARGIYSSRARGTALVDVIEARGELQDDQDPAEVVSQFLAKIHDACGVPPPT